MVPHLPLGAVSLDMENEDAFVWAFGGWWGV